LFCYCLPQIICLLFLCPDFDMHSGEDIATYTKFSLRLFLDQRPYYHQLKFLCFFIASMLSPSRFLSSAQAGSWCVPFNFSPTGFPWTFLMSYSNAKLKISGDRAFPCFRLFWIGKLSRNQRFHSLAWNFVHWLPRYASTIVYHCIALLELLYRWQHQSRQLWIPHRIYARASLTAQRPITNVAEVRRKKHKLNTKEGSLCIVRLIINHFSSLFTYVPSSTANDKVHIQQRDEQQHE
jgi:hypothetical protein